MMTTLDRVLIEKAGRENGWEHIVQSDDHAVTLASARHPAQTFIRKEPGENTWTLCISGDLIIREMKRSFPSNDQNNSFRVFGHDLLSHVLRRAAELAQSLPNQALETYLTRINDLTQTGIHTTEAERMIKQRIGQSTFREALLDYWEDACSVTGLALPEILRASHAKPWANCETDAERLDVYNGFLLNANLDALFDRGLITFDNMGTLHCSTRLSSEHKKWLQIDNNIRLRWLTENHIPYLTWHQTHIFS